MADIVQIPTAKESDRAHRNADTDGKSLSIHHTLGPGHNQAAAGDHSHNGGASVNLLDGYIVNDLASCIVALKALGAS